MDLAESQGMTNREAMEEVIETFRDLEILWKDYIYSQGLETLKGLLDPKEH